MAIFPYDEAFEPFINFQQMNCDFKIESLYSMKGWGFVDDIIPIDDSNIVVKDIANYYPDDTFDTCIIINSSHMINGENLFSAIKMMAKAGKNLIITRNMSDSEKERTKELCKSYGVNVKFVSDAYDNDVMDNADILYEINTPIVVIVGLGERTDKCFLQNELARKLIQDKYNVAWISSHEEAILYGGDLFPKLMFAESINGKKKILCFNHYLKAVEAIKSPDLFLISIPGGIMPDSKKQVGHFGLMAFYILNAINPDYCITSLYYSNFDSEYLNELNNVMKYKFNTEIDSFYLSNNAQDVYTLDKISPVEYINIDNKMVLDKIYQINSIDGSIFGRKEIDKLYFHMIERLSEYDEYKVL